MRQLHLPVFPAGVTDVSPKLAVQQADGRVTYFHGLLPVFSHAVDDIRTFRMITSQFCVNGQTTQAQIVAAFGVTSVSVKRSVKLYREHGPAGFYGPRKTRGKAVLTAEVCERVQTLLSAGNTVSEVAKRLGLKQNTLSKAVNAGRFHLPAKKGGPRAGVPTISPHVATPPTI